LSARQSDTRIHRNASAQHLYRRDGVAGSFRRACRRHPFDPAFGAAGGGRRGDAGGLAGRGDGAAPDRLWPGAQYGELVTVVLQLSRFDPRIDIAVPQLGLPEQSVAGGETRIPLAPDGHYWVRAEINGAPANFLIDTGATISAVSPAVAARAGLTPRRGGIPVQINTANGSVTAQIASADRLSFGNVAAEGIDVVIAPGLGDTNIIGMNLLSRLEGWRVENGVMVLTPARDDEK
jgi:aspartyl protease family protein